MSENIVMDSVPDQAISGFRRASQHRLVTADPLKEHERAQRVAGYF